MNRWAPAEGQEWIYQELVKEIQASIDGGSSNSVADIIHMKIQQNWYSIHNPVTMTARLHEHFGTSPSDVNVTLPRL